MVFWLLFAILTGFYGTIYRSFKTFPFIISKYLGEFTGGPKFLTKFIDVTDGFENRGSHSQPLRIVRDIKYFLI